MTIEILGIALPYLAALMYYLLSNSVLFDFEKHTLDYYIPSAH
ncbi:hypothetical protein BBJK_01505 [Bifidobacterium bifidum LMG 13195]|uniref:Uncharacterized protein n=1 Tax=Bifidobacterium bifidum LMG 13195 TaxID=1207542 RepID=A0A286TCV4_BIFBI|nr:hypothetical protein BBJK_01505 [Bifidobacterium bifidum LMG 13195]